MSRPSPTPAPGAFERAAWIALLATIAVCPLAVAKFPWSEIPLTYTALQFPQTIAFVAGLSITLVLWSVALIRRETNIALGWRLIPFAAFLAWAAVATVSAFEPLRALFGKSTSALSLTGIASLTVLLFLLVQLTGSRQRVLLLTRTVCYSAVAVSLLALLQQLFNVDPFGMAEVESWMLGRGYGTLGNPDHLGTFLVLPAILWLGLALTEDDTMHRSIAFAGFGVVMAALVGTLTRGAWIGVLFGVIALAIPAWLMAPERRRALAVSGGVLLVGALVAIAASDAVDLRGRFSAQPTAPAASVPTDAADTVLSGRLGLWRIAFDIAADRPLVGTGPASYELGWYPRAEGRVSLEGTVAIGDDAHSLFLTTLATTGYPGLLLLLASVGIALVFAVRTCSSLVRRGHSSAFEVLYVAWTAGSLGLLASLAVGVVSTPIAVLTFIGLGVLLRPGVRSVSVEWLRVSSVGVALVIAVALVSTLPKPFAAERALVRAAAGEQSVEAAREQVAAVPWNQDVQSAFCQLRVQEIDVTLSRNPSAAAEDISAFASQLAQAGAAQPGEYLYPSVRAHVLTRASEFLGPEGYAEEAVAAADRALAIMPSSIGVRVDKALALSDLRRYAEMAQTLERHWELEVQSPYPGILYAQALALSGRPDEAWGVFDLLNQRFPGDASIEAARSQTQELLQQQ